MFPSKFDKESRCCLKCGRQKEGCDSSGSGCDEKYGQDHGFVLETQGKDVAQVKRLFKGRKRGFGWRHGLRGLD